MIRDLLRPLMIKPIVTRTLVMLIVITTSIVNVQAACSLGGCGSSGADEQQSSWDASAEAFMNSDIPAAGVVPTGTTTSFKTLPQPEGNNTKQDIETTKSSMEEPITSGQTVGAATSEQFDQAQPEDRSSQFPGGRWIKPLLSVSSSDVVVDVTGSNSNSSGERHIIGSVHIPIDSLIYENGTLRTPTELTAILGSAGIARKDPVVIYSDNLSSGEVTMAFWIMRYLGSDNIKVLDGGLKDWMDASLPLAANWTERPSATYGLKPNEDLLSNYSRETDRRVQLVDARRFQDYGKSRLPGAIDIDSARVLDGGRIKDSAALSSIFSSLSKDRPVIVYADDYFKASLDWYALQLMGYDSSIYLRPDQRKEISD